MWWFQFRNRRRAHPAAGSGPFSGLLPGNFLISQQSVLATMEPAFLDGMPGDVLIVEDDPIIALDFEDTILGFGVKFVRTAGNVAKALEMIADRAPDFALLDVGLIREKSFAIAERLDQLKIPFVFVTGYGGDLRLTGEFADRPELPKPYPSDALQALLKQRSGDGAGR